jgi:hypothetical protein
LSSAAVDYSSDTRKLALLQDDRQELYSGLCILVKAFGSLHISDKQRNTYCTISSTLLEEKIVFLRPQ